MLLLLLKQLLLCVNREAGILRGCLLLLLLLHTSDFLHSRQ